MIAKLNTPPKKQTERISDAYLHCISEQLFQRFKADLNVRPSMEQDCDFTIDLNGSKKLSPQDVKTAVENIAPGWSIEIN